MLADGWPIDPTGRSAYACTPIQTKSQWTGLFDWRRLHSMIRGQEGVADAQSTSFIPRRLRLRLREVQKEKGPYAT